MKESKAVLKGELVPSLITTMILCNHQLVTDYLLWYNCNKDFIFVLLNKSLDYTKDIIIRIIKDLLSKVGSYDFTSEIFSRFGNLASDEETFTNLKKIVGVEYRIPSGKPISSISLEEYQSDILYLKDLVKGFQYFFPFLRSPFVTLELYIYDIILSKKWDSEVNLPFNPNLFYPSIDR